jgi:guanylate kinase
MLNEQESKARGMLIVVSSPSGGGKGTLIRRILNEEPYIISDLGYSVSFTTRKPREGEIEGKHYHFVSLEQFKQMQDCGEFLEWAEVHGNLYGTAHSEIKRELELGKDIILEIDVQGAATVRHKVPDAVKIFILPPSFEVLRARLIGRGTETPEGLQLRLRNSRSEVEAFKEFDYVILNDDLNQASAQLSSIIQAERARRIRQTHLAERVLATFPEEKTTSN